MSARSRVKVLTRVNDEDGLPTGQAAVTEQVQDMAQGGNQGICTHVFLHDEPCLIHDRASRLDKVQAGPPRDTRLQAPGEDSTLGAVALGDTLERVAIVAVVVGGPVQAARDLFCAELAVADIFRDVPDRERTWLAGCPKFLQGVSAQGKRVTRVCRDPCIWCNTGIIGDGASASCLLLESCDSLLEIAASHSQCRS